MATTSVMSAMSADDDRTVHPFFSRQQGERHIALFETTLTDRSGFGQNVPQLNETHGDESENVVGEESGKPKRTNGRRKKPADVTRKTQKTLGEIVNPQATETVNDAGAVRLHTSEPDIDQGSRKRRRTNDLEATDVATVDVDAATGTVDEPTAQEEEGRRSPIVLIPASSPPPQEAAAANQPEPAVPNTPPKKLLKLNAQGRFSSPPSKKVQDLDESEQPSTRRSTRRRKSAKSPPEKHLVVELKYGKDDAERQNIGERIQRILSDEERILLSTRTASQKPPSNRSKPSKPTHPFFAKDPPEARQKQLQRQDSPRKASAVTPGKLRMQSFGDRALDLQDPVHVFTSALLKDRQMIKHPGAKEPLFPTREQLHVRSLDSPTVDRLSPDLCTDIPLRPRKRKQAQLPFPRNESLLLNFASHLHAEADRELRSDGFHEPPASLHVPRRLLISGQEIAERVAKEVSLPLFEDDVDELSTSPQKFAHPALRRLYLKVPTVLTAFDQSKGEAQAWSQKYAPLTSADVLQPEKEMAILREWMKSLEVQAVIGALVSSGKPTSTKSTEKPKKKRKKKPDEMDDFLVDDDVEVHDMSEVLGDSNETNSSRRTVHSVVQTTQDGTKLSNAVLLSGPNGCGKTAAAYAVAKELGFKVFEISSSERRTGRDVLDRVGDMTANHLVKHHGVEDAGNLSSIEEPSRNEEAFQNDLQSGRQGKMISFFKPQASKRPSAPLKPIKEKVMKVVQEALKKPAKDQQQSLILLEEVDVLFKDDKDFWTAVLNLISTSKRPFIMTCNDEDLVPLQAMSLHAILRLAQPPAELATDYLLLLAAAEGHVLRRHAVASLYEQYELDLRASITALDYWCQMGIGDPRGGLAWIYQRWPPGSDVDHKGRRLRIVSESTYQQGTGLPQESKSTEDALLWLWLEHGVEPSAALGWQSEIQDDIAAGSELEQPAQGLRQLARRAEALSAADICCANELNGSILDTSQPQMPDKARGHYIEGLRLLQTDEHMDWTNISKELFTALVTSAHRTFSDRKLDENHIVRKTLSRKPLALHANQLSRRAFACFDSIAAPSESSLTATGLQQSAFDGTFETIALDLAPYVRSIVQYDQALEEQRERIDLLTSDGRRPKRARTTRAARSAVEGGPRATVRKQRWFTETLNASAVLATGGDSWPRLCGTLGTASVGSRDETQSGTPAASLEEDEEIRHE